MSLQRPGSGLIHDPAAVIEDPRTIMDADPALRALFDRYGRDLPQALLPNPAN